MEGCNGHQLRVQCSSFNVSDVICYDVKVTQLPEDHQSLRPLFDPNAPCHWAPIEPAVSDKLSIQ